MKQIKVFVAEQVLVSTTGTNLTQATTLCQEARRNKAKVLDGALTVEHELAAILSYYFFGRSHERKATFEALVLNSDWCSFAAKRKLIAHIIDEQRLLSAKEKTACEKLLRGVMSLRNAFAHGTLSSDDKTVWLSYFEGTPRKQELTDDFLSSVETTLWTAYNTVFALAQKIGVVTLTGNHDAAEPSAEPNGGPAAPPPPAPTKQSMIYTAVRCSADGRELVAVSTWGGGGPIVISTNSGASWTQTSAPGDCWTSVSCSGDGRKLAAGAQCSNTGGPIYVSTDNGGTWQQGGGNAGPHLPWVSLASSADGSTILAADQTGFFGGMMISTDSGATWVNPGADTTSFPWGNIASSANGLKLAATIGPRQPVYTSTNAGTNWTQTSGSGAGLASSADGTRLVTVDSDSYYAGAIYTSADSGVTWASNSALVAHWKSVACSADGSRLVAVVNGGTSSTQGGIYTCQTIPTPVLNVTPSEDTLVLSWIIPSQPFVLQEIVDLTTTDWSDVPTVPVPNFTNLQNQVTLPLAVANRFYRLKATVN